MHLIIYVLMSRGGYCNRIGQIYITITTIVITIITIIPSITITILIITTVINSHKIQNIYISSTVSILVRVAQASSIFG